MGIIYVPRTLIVPRNATATANNILASETLFRVGIFSELFAGVAFIFLVMALYRLLSGVNETHAWLMVTLTLVSISISFLNVLNNIAALTLFRGADFLLVFDKRQLDALAMLFLRLHGRGIVINEISWGLWLFPFGVLVMRSGFLPRILGILLIVNCFAYLAISLTSSLLPGYASVVSRVSLLPMAAGELSVVAWLLIKGAKVPPLAAAASWSLAYFTGPSSPVVLDKEIKRMGTAGNTSTDCRVTTAAGASARNGSLCTHESIVYSNYGSPDVLECEENEKPPAEEDEVVIKVRAASVSPLDGHLMRGKPYIGRLLFGLRTWSPWW